MWDYSDKVREYFLHPKNVGEIENPDAEAEVGNIACGDALKLTLKIDKDSKKILDAKFKTFGCGSAIASSSILTELIIGKTVEEALKITDESIADSLGGLPKEKMHCSVMGTEALHEALAKYTGAEVKTHALDAKVICKCFNVTDEQIVKIIKEHNLKTVEEVTNYTKAGGGCGGCKQDIQDILDEFWNKAESKLEVKRQEKMTNLQKIKLIEQVISEDISPSLQKDGGDVELIDIDRDLVIVKFSGACQGCPNVGNTLKGFVEKILREKVSENIVVEYEK